MGLAFDGNIHSIAGSYFFDPLMNRTVGVHPQINRLGIREINPYLDLDLYTDLNANLETRGLESIVRW